MGNQHGPVLTLSSIAGRGQGSRSRVGKVVQACKQAKWIIDGPFLQSTAMHRQPTYMAQQPDTLSSTGQAVLSRHSPSPPGACCHFILLCFYIRPRPRHIIVGPPCAMACGMWDASGGGTNCTGPRAEVSALAMAMMMARLEKAANATTYVCYVYTIPYHTCDTMYGSIHMLPYQPNLVRARSSLTGDPPSLRP